MPLYSVDFSTSRETEQFELPDDAAAWGLLIFIMEEMRTLHAGRLPAGTSLIIRAMTGTRQVAEVRFTGQGGGARG